MRRYHRWLSIVFGIVILWVVVTGLMSHAAALVRDGQGAAGSGSAAAAVMAQAKAAGFVCPEAMTCRAKPDPDSAAAWTSYLHHLHAGEEFGLTGTIISIATGLALLFFAISGLVMYIDLFRGRLKRTSTSGDQSKWFWK